MKGADLGRARAEGWKEGARAFQGWVEGADLGRARLLRTDRAPEQGTSEGGWKEPRVGKRARVPFKGGCKTKVKKTTLISMCMVNIHLYSFLLRRFT